MEQFLKVQQKMEAIIFDADLGRIPKRLIPCGTCQKSVYKDLS